MHLGKKCQNVQRTDAIAKITPNAKSARCVGKSRPLQNQRDALDGSGITSCNANLHGLRSAGSECRQLANETLALCDVARTKCRTVKSFSNDMKDSFLQAFGGDIDASTFVNIKQLVRDDKAKQTIAAAIEMDDIAFEMAMKSKQMTRLMRRGIKSLPDPVREELEAENFGADDDDIATEIMLDIDQDVEELETCTQSLNRMNVFTAATSGKDAFEGLANKEEICQILLDKMKEMSASVASLSHVLSGNYCAMMTSGQEMFKCLRLSKLLTEAADSVHQLIKAIIHFIKTVWKKVHGFAEEFVSAKNPNRFVKAQADKFASSRVMVNSLLRY